MASDLTQLGFLLFVSALVAMLTRRLHLPYTVGWCSPEWLSISLMCTSNGISQKI
jgi:hypothetical protein